MTVSSTGRRPYLSAARPKTNAPMKRAGGEAYVAHGVFPMALPDWQRVRITDTARLRDWLLKGGFLWADDFWGDWAWDVFESQMRKALPSSTYPIVDLPLDHPIFHGVMQVRRFPQIPSINFRAGTGQTSERGRDSAQPHVRAILDPDDPQRILVLMTHNTDFGDAFEREGDDRAYFLKFAPDGYAFGVNAIVYSMMH